MHGFEDYCFSSQIPFGQGTSLYTWGLEKVGYSQSLPLSSKDREAVYRRPSARENDPFKRDLIEQKKERENSIIKTKQSTIKQNKIREKNTKSNK